MSARLRPGHLIAAAVLAGTAALPVWSGAAVAERRAGAPAVPQRVVAASILSAEVLCEILPSHRLAAVTVLATDPRFSLAAARLADAPTVGQGPEQLLGVRPDLVITDPFTQQQTQILLEAAGVAVVRTSAVRNFDDVVANIRLLGQVTAREAAAEDLVARLRQRLATVAARAGQLATWRVMNLNGSLDTYGRGSLFDAAVQVAGAVNLPAQHGVGAYQPLDIETVLGWRPDAVIVAGAVAGQTDRAGGPLPPWFAAHPGLPLLPCVRRGHVLQLPSALLSATSHHAVELAEQLQDRLLRWGRP